MAPQNETTRTNRPLKICVIGAGAAGLCCARHLLARPERFEVELFEQTGNVSGTWMYRNEVGEDDNGLRIHSSMYKNLKTNIPLNVMEFPDFACSKKHEGFFVGHQQVFEYLSDYAEHFELKKCMKFYQQVFYVERLDQGKWQVHIRDLATKQVTVSVYDGICVCNGRYARPRTPKVRKIESFTGTVLHSHDYRVPEQFEGQRIVVLGAGPSGIDISLELGQVADFVYLVHQLPQNYKDLPQNFEQIKSTITEIEDGNTVVLANGQRLPNIDTVMFCTGYEYDFQFLDKNCGLEVTQGGRVSNAFLHLVNIDNPTMAIWAIPMRILPFPIYHQQALLFTKILCNEVPVPSREEMIKHTEADYQYRLADGIPERHAHKMPGAYIWRYEDELIRYGQLEPIRPVIKAIFDSLHRYRSQNSQGYKQLRFLAIDEQSYEVINPDGTRKVFTI